MVDFFVLNFWVCFLNGAVELEVELLSAILLLLVGHSRTLGHSLFRGLLESSLPSWNLASLDPFQPSLLLGGQETVALCWDWGLGGAAEVDAAGKPWPGGIVHPQMG